MAIRCCIRNNDRGWEQKRLYSNTIRGTSLLQKIVRETDAGERSSAKSSDKRISERRENELGQPVFSSL